MSATSDGRVATTKRAESEADRVRVLAEASALSEIRHPNVVELLDVDPEAGSISTAFCARTTLAESPPTSMQELADLAESLVTVLSELHQLGWAHGGLSANHCLVANGNRIVLCSFGRARRISGPSHPSARADRDALRSMLASWRAALAPSQQRKDRDATARLERAVASTGAKLPLFRRPPSTDDTTPRSNAPTIDRTIGIDSMRPALARAAMFAVMLAALTLLHAPSASGSQSDSLLATTAKWTLTIGRPLALYGLVASIVCAIAVRTRRERWLRVGRRLAPAPFRRIICGVALAGAVSTIASHLTASSPTHGIVAEAQHAFTPAGSPTTSTSTTSTTTSTTTTTVPVAPPQSASPAADLPPTPATPATLAVAEPSRWTIGTGDHMWRVAEVSLALSWGRRPTEVDIDAYWRSLIAANRDRLADPRNPDLVFVGQVLDLPPIPPAPAAEAA
jgi:serine/threonine protein kinase